MRDVAYIENCSFPPEWGEIATGKCILHEDTCTLSIKDNPIETGRVAAGLETDSGAKNADLRTKRVDSSTGATPEFAHCRRRIRALPSRIPALARKPICEPKQADLR